jgi:eukaryotic-like serine/threonine-protein kinase
MDLPRQFGPYRLLRRLGHGGMAEVFLAVAHGASGFEKRVALKMLLPELQGDGEFERILIDEARRAAGFAHRNLVGVHDLGCVDGTYFVRMDWVDGADLATVLSAAPLAPNLALLVVEELAHALAYLHGLTDDAGRALGLVHRDVSPANVLLSRAGDVKLGDFGIAKATLLADATRGGVRKGKYAYMSPEQVTGSPLTSASDQFALGITLHESLTGRRPYDADSPLETMERVRACAPIDLTALDTDLAAIIARCLARAPRDRFADMTALARTLSTARRTRPPATLEDLGRRCPPAAR